MKQSLQLKLGQQLTMTPQLQQAIRLLQLSTLDLQQEIQEALDSNPMLEVTEGESEPSDSANESLQSNTNDKESSPSENASEASNEDYSTSDYATNDTPSETPSDEWQENIPNELPVDTQWDDIYQGSGVSSSAVGPERDDSFFDSQIDNTETLQEHLLWQLNLTPMSDRDRSIAIAIIDSVEPSGLLSSSIEEIYQGLLHTPEQPQEAISEEETTSKSSTPSGSDTEEAFDSTTPLEGPKMESHADHQHDDDGNVDNENEDEALTLEEVLAVQHRLQRFDPVGCCSQNLSECLMVQLNQFDSQTPFLGAAKLIVMEHLTLLGNRDYKQLMRRCKLKEPELKEVVGLIQSLTPQPGAALGGNQTSYVVPDVFVQKKEGRWVVELNPEIAPKLRINSNYASLVKRADSSNDNAFLRDNLQEARWFLKSLQSRNETLLKVASCIVDKQQGFLDHGPEAMRPLVLHDIAEDVGMHESTISRVTTQKYMHTPQGIFELKFFFSSHVSMENGGECSSTAIRAIIKKLVAAEDPRKPLSDSKITALLADQGIKVARRTIAKYRESLGISASNERKQLI
ncbi:RNA polymerase factor sigma-54 [Marinibactrum halimedae]|uniref:RNA polymerase sigma-54 factor n=1 Tax=Marinibactrum halimedae TaxID=1444977 RepID=A0AA37TA07_9GAMM|nr:RNA polymerase factor sigma-54 [Marinibactrum halimedae]MCD9457524.1 RNA polymerase factor sigma-54 [Marinibactrum halimedae]GLS25422.1 RNA polymerase sigma-54 factor [Marinibactrum halimedae]